MCAGPGFAPSAHPLTNPTYGRRAQSRLGECRASPHAGSTLETVTASTRAAAELPAVIFGDHSYRSDLYQ